MATNVPRPSEQLSKLRVMLEEVLDRRRNMGPKSSIRQIMGLLDEIGDGGPRGHQSQYPCGTTGLTDENRQLAIGVLAILNRPGNLATVVDDLLGLIKRSTEVDAVGLRLREGDDYPYYVQNGFLDDFVAKEKTLCLRDAAGQVVRDSSGRPVLECMCGVVLRGRTDPSKPFFTKGGSFWTNGTTDLLASTADSDRGTHMRNHCNREGYESVALIPVRIGHEIVGLLQLNDRGPGRFSVETVHFMEGICDSIGIAIARKRTVEQLREVSARDEAILAAIPNIVMQVDKDKVYTWANPAGLEFFGPDVVGKCASEFFIGRQNVYAKVQPIFDGDEGVVYLESWQHRADGANRLLAWWCKMLKDAKGDVMGALSVAQDITERHQAEEALRESEGRYRSLFENMLEGFAYCQMIHEDSRPVDFVYLAVNDSFERLTGLKDVAGKKVSEVIPGIRQMHPELFEVYDRVASTGRPERIELYIKPLKVWLAISVYSPQRAHFVAVFDNITDRKQAEEALKASEGRSRLLADVVERSSQPFAISYPDGSLGFFNAAFGELLGYTRQELQAMNWRGDLTAPEWRRREADAFAEIDRTGRPGRYEKECLRKDGSRVAVGLLAHQVRDADGATQYYYAFVTDLTERKRAEDALRQSQAQLLQAQKMEAIGLLAGGVAHDFRNQLTVIKGYGEMLIRRGLVSGAAAEYVGQILKAADRSAGLSGQLLAFGRQQDLHPEVVNLNDLLTDLSKSLDRLVGEDVQSCVVRGADLSAVRVDPMGFQQAVMNLVINARDAMPNGGQLTVETANVVLDEAFVAGHVGASPGPHVVVSITDTGTGMSEETLRRAFEPFYTTKPPGQGSGLGLSMVYGFVKQSGGCIFAHGEPGHGATFTIYLPQVQEAPASGSQPVASAELPRGSGTILVVEDEPSIRAIVAHTLRDCGYTVLEASGPNDALPLGEHYEGGIDLLITDVVMPGLSGPEIAAQIARVRPKMPVLYISGYADRALANRGIAGAGVHLLTKPLSSQVLAETVRKIIAGSEG